MPKEQTDLYTSIVLISLVFLVIVVGLIILVTSYYRKKKIHLIEKRELNQKFESELLKTQIEVQEQTMQTIASNLHDNIGQLLSLTNITLGSIDISNTEKAETKINTSVELVNKSIKELRELAKLLQGEQLLQNGIGYAIEQEVNWLRKTEAYEVIFENGMLEQASASPQTDLVILRLFQEISNNIIKHAQATKIVIQLHQEENQLFLSIKENGIGFDYQMAKNSGQGLGLNSIEKKAQLINGSLDVQSSLNKGTQIVIQIPYP
jgi:signal transduction histidine kinase